MDDKMHAESDDEHVDGKAAGGRARAEKLTPQRRTEISRAAAKKRWESVDKVAICGSTDKPLVIGDIELTCYVLDDGTRVLTQSSFLHALGRHRRANTRASSGVPPILQGQAIAPFIPDEVLAKAEPITFRPPSGGKASGYNAELLPDVCEIYLEARESERSRGSRSMLPGRRRSLSAGLPEWGSLRSLTKLLGIRRSDSVMHSP